MTRLPPSQYADDRNLRARQRLWEHQRPPFDVVSWAVNIAGIGAGMQVLDVGCGNGRYLRALRALGAEAVGVDVSLGMMRSAPAGGLVAADAVALPLPAATFDAVLAPHMLYHVEDRIGAARELRRVLRPGGTCVAVANGAGHLASLRALVEDAVQTQVPQWRWPDPLGRAFSLENGVDQLAVAFDEVDCLRPETPGRAVVTDPDVVADYVASVADVYAAAAGVSWEKVVDSVRAQAARRIVDGGAFVVQGDVGAIVCR